MIPPPPSNDQAFFEVAATLIPLLLLGGVLTERLRPSRSLSSGVMAWAYVAIVLFGTLVIWAEVAAITSLIEGSSPTLIAC